MIGSSLEFYPCLWTRKKSSGIASYGALGHVPPSTSNNCMFSSLWSKSDSQLSKYCVVCEISWCRCQRLAALLISTASVTKLLGLVIKPLLHPTLKSAVSAPWPNFQLCPSSQQIFATPLGPTASSQTEPEPWSAGVASLSLDRLRATVFPLLYGDQMSYFQTTTGLTGPSVPHLNAGEQKEHIPPPGAVVALLWFWPRIQNYVLTYLLYLTPHLKRQQPTLIVYLGSPYISAAYNSNVAWRNYRRM